MMAAQGGQEVIVKLLVEGGAELQSHSCEENSLTALVVAAGKGQTTIVEYLLSQGASLCFHDTEFHRDAGYNSLAEAANRGHSALAKMIVTTLDGPNLRKNCGGTSVAIAAKHGCWELVRVLLKMGARADPPVSDDFGRTPLAAALSRGDLNLIEMLLDGGTDPNHIDNTRLAPLTHAALKENY